MKFPDIADDLLSRARAGELLALDSLLVAIQPAIFNLAIRMLGHREDAQDACQEILLRITTHLGGFKGESSFGTWAYRVASNHLLSARTRIGESPETSLEALEDKLGAGVEIVARAGEERSLLPEEKLEARRIALSCTQSMLMALDREQRLAYILDVVFGLSSRDAARVLQIGAAAYRQRLSRARRRLDEFMARRCGLVSATASCRCETQVRAIHIVSRHAATAPSARLEVHPPELAAAEREFGDLLQMSDAAAVFRGHPQYQAADSMIGAVRAVLRAYEGRSAGPH